ncbi:aldehyde dehydrogenase, dimeric NADP-preferring-like [Dendronephthya gigantea]|uniref:aldehyde dehydrogenase, dimeric NADP-preferring-like n=1 Tax=Dendronephthya gigantea TaxID=151771 RepID=UPI00106A4196|nr:aldehyde dehydrogenase, dimeric NADP-preferring-like [Dendronephthya gigantea]
MDPKTVVGKLHAAFLSGKTRSLEFRKQQLHQLHKLLSENKDELLDALQEDLRKPLAESILFEVQFALSETCDALNNIDDWVKPVYVPKDILNKMNTIYNIYEPLGVSLIITPWNYPIMIIFMPLVAAIAAGNCVLIKPSELAPKTGALAESLISKYLDKACYAVMQGGVEETTEILKCKFDHIFYTGGSAVGKIIVKAAAENLSKITLELGGKSPVYINKDSDLKLVSRRVLWGRFANAGQTCVSPDYVMCHPSVQDELVKNMKDTIKEFFGEDPKKSEHFGRIINSRHFNRLKKLMESGEIAIGGETDEDDRYIAPTILVDVVPSDTIMQEEIFGPVLPIINVEDEDEAIAFVNSREKPLALYVFANDKKIIEKFIANTSSGGVCGNDTLLHASADHLPFGGVGHSGAGSYHGKAGFEEFSHKKPVFVTAQMLESLNSMRYPPYNDTSVNRMTWLLGKTLKKTPSGLLYIPSLVFGFLGNIAMKILGLPRYFLS